MTDLSFMLSTEPWESIIAEFWLVFMHQLPAKPEALRVKVWRRLQKLGAMALKNSVYVLPDTTEHNSSLQLLMQDISQAGGDSYLFRTSKIEGLDWKHMIKMHEKSLLGEMKPLLKEGKANLKKIADNKLSSDDLMDLQHSYGKLLSALKKLKTKDHFQFSGLGELEENIRQLSDAFKFHFAGAAIIPEIGLVGPRTWVTRRNMGVDRLASAWLIIRFIDPKASIICVDFDTYRHQNSHLRFDVFPGEFTHEDDNCTFETLILRFQVSNPRLKRLGEIIHDLDFKDNKFQHTETFQIREFLVDNMTAKSDEVRMREAFACLDKWLAEPRV